MRVPLGPSWPNEVENRPFSSDLFYLFTFPRGRTNWETPLRGKRKRRRREHFFSSKIRPDLSQKHPNTSAKNFFRFCPTPLQISTILLQETTLLCHTPTPPPLPHPPHTNQGERSHNNALLCCNSPLLPPQQKFLPL